MLLSQAELTELQAAELESRAILLFRDLRDIQSYLQASAEFSETVPTLRLEEAKMFAQAQGTGTQPEAGN